MTDRRTSVPSTSLVKPSLSKRLPVWFGYLRRVAPTGTGRFDPIRRSQMRPPWTPPSTASSGEVLGAQRTIIGRKAE